MLGRGGNNTNKTRSLNKRDGVDALTGVCSSGVGVGSDDGTSHTQSVSEDVFIRGVAVAHDHSLNLCTGAAKVELHLNCAQTALSGGGGGGGGTSTAQAVSGIPPRNLAVVRHIDSMGVQMLCNFVQ